MRYAQCATSTLYINLFGLKQKKSPQNKWSESLTYLLLPLNFFFFSLLFYLDPLLSASLGKN